MIDSSKKPVWASKKANGNYFLPMVRLPTRDGKLISNSLFLGRISDNNSSTVYQVLTDTNEILNLEPEEITELFHPPVWVAKRSIPDEIYNTAFNAGYSKALDDYHANIDNIESQMAKVWEYEEQQEILDEANFYQF